jgi:POT family proton-dependent oligopeptide transporter
MSLLSMPRQVPFIVTMEACERFSFYGMLSILTLYLKNELVMAADDAKTIVHMFKMAVYFLPLAGAWVADRWLGRYRTILGLSLFYCLGHGLLALLEGSIGGVYAGLALIALGAGGIKPCVSAFVGDQFSGAQEGLLPKVYGLFYWGINLGALFAFALIPLVRDHAGYSWAFGIPGLFMMLSAGVFWAGSRLYIKQPPEAARRGGAGDLAGHDAVAAADDREGKASRARVVGRIALVLLPVPVFWALYDQINSSWVLQGERMIPFVVLGYKVDAERIQSVSALLVLFWVPVLTLGVYPLAERLGLRPTALRRMGCGMVFAAASFVICAWLQRRIEAGEELSLVWQILPYTVLELGEVLVSATGLEFAYSQAPKSLKSVVMSLWLLTTAAGNFLVAAITTVNSMWVGASGAAEFLFYAALMLVVAAVFGLLARRYRTWGGQARARHNAKVEEPG